MKLGDKITIRHKLVRKELYRPNENGKNVRHKEWKPTVLKSALEVLVIGKRKLQNGTTFRDTGMEIFEPKEFFDALLVVESLHKRPFYVMGGSVLMPVETDKQ